ncbi:hypothetical protein [Treponema sp. C6A8]|uniref:hypothetical protein n=1 Tax=Treponema sp. C6A8 TaxID=1410609 RepID=UPI000481A06F|nr:hypothetical protein [Treponema sp. C6A8]
MLRTVNEKETRFIDALLTYEGCKYKLGKSDRFESDCSGSVCGALSYAYNCNIRVTANELLKKYFTKAYSPFTGGIHAAFFLNKSGKAVHIAGGLYGKLFMNVSSIEVEKRGHVRNLVELSAMYPDYKLVLRSLNKGVLE